MIIIYHHYHYRHWNIHLNVILILVYSKIMRTKYFEILSLVRAVVDDENDYSKTKQIVEHFAKGIGRELHEQLKTRIEKQQERNWVR